MEFDFWQQWGGELGDVDFARAWVALGIVAGSRVKPPASEGYIGLLARNPAAATADINFTIARSALADALSASREHAGRVRWTFPSAATTIDADQRFPLIRIGPAPWALAWDEVAGLVEVQPRLRVTAAPEKDAIAPWFRVLSEAKPSPSAVSLMLRAPDASLALEWPLRIGTLRQGGGDPIMRAMLSEWPSSRLARAVSIDRDNANCDILMHVGDAASLLAGLRAQPCPCKANIVVLAGAIETDPDALNARLRAIVTETRASGIVLQSSTNDLGALGYAWNKFVEEMSHNATVDRALHLAMSRYPASDTIIWLSNALADTRLRLLADRLTLRVHKLAAGSTIDVSRLNPGWLRSKGQALSRERSGPKSSIDLVRADPASLEFDMEGLRFDAESHAASELAELATAVDHAVQPIDAEARHAARYLQQQSFVDRGGEYAEARHGFFHGCRALVRIRIGPPDSKWQSLPKEFPVEQLPPEHKQWRLTLWLSEPSQLRKPMRATVMLPHEGPSTECEFRFTPRQIGWFEGRLTVLHRGRVLQTAVLRAEVTALDAVHDQKTAPILSEFIAVRHRLGDLDFRRQFDLAFVTNHTVAGDPRGVALSADRAWIADVSKSLEITKDINTALSRVARSVADFSDGIDGAAGRALLVDLAKKGAWLQLYLVNNQLKNSRNRPDIAEKEFIQIVSTRSDATVPFEFIYDYEVPDDDAALCPRWRDSMVQGKCPSICDTGNAETVCPMGFWGLRKVIERHQVSPEHASDGKEYFLQSEPGRDSADLSLGGTALLASSKRVPDDALEAVRQTLAAKLGTAPQTATSWSDWASIVGHTKPEPRFLLALPHTDGTGANVTLEIGGDTLSTIQIKPAHLRAGGDIHRPLVALLGCDLAGTANDYGEHVVVFRDRGAAIVIGTIATVFGAHAARVAALLAEELIPKDTPPERLGEAIRALKRRALLDGLLMPLCVVAYGDADWRLTK